MQTKFMDTKSSDSFVYTTNYPCQFGKFKNYSSKIQNGVVAISFGICRDHQNYNFSKYMYKQIQILFEAWIFDYCHRCFGYLQVNRYHRVAKFLR